MVRDERGGSGTARALSRLLVLAGASTLLWGCASGVAAGVAAVAVTVGFVTRSCYDSVQITVVDGATGLRTCKANVTASDAEGSPDTLDSCYYAHLPEGQWTISATLPGYVTETTRIVVPDRDGCPHAVHTVEITLRPASAAPPVLAPITPAPIAPVPTTPAPVAPAPITPEPIAPAPPPATSPDGTQPEPVAPPAPDGTEPAPATPSEPPPAPGPPVQRFPEAP